MFLAPCHQHPLPSRNTTLTRWSTETSGHQACHVSSARLTKLESSLSARWKICLLEAMDLGRHLILYVSVPDMYIDCILAKGYTPKPCVYVFGNQNTWVIYIYIDLIIMYNDLQIHICMYMYALRVYPCAMIQSWGKTSSSGTTSPQPNGIVSSLVRKALQKKGW